MKKSFLKTKTVHGVKTGNHSNPNVLKAARASGGSCMVEGGSARPSMSRPKMMRADGGKVDMPDAAMTDPSKKDRKNGGGIFPRFKAKSKDNDKDDC